MTHAEIVTKMQAEVANANLAGGLSPETIGNLQTLALNILNDAERRRQQCLAQAETLKKQALGAEGEAAAYAHTMSSAYQVFHAMLERVVAGVHEQQAREKERAAKGAETDEGVVTQPIPSKPGRKAKAKAK